MRWIWRNNTIRDAWLLLRCVVAADRRACSSTPSTCAFASQHSLVFISTFAMFGKVASTLGSF